MKLLKSISIFLLFISCQSDKKIEIKLNKTEIGNSEYSEISNNSLRVKNKLLGTWKLTESEIDSIKLPNWSESVTKLVIEFKSDNVAVFQTNDLMYPKLEYSYKIENDSMIDFGRGCIPKSNTKMKMVDNKNLKLTFIKGKASYPWYKNELKLIKLK